MYGEPSFNLLLREYVIYLINGFSVTMYLVYFACDVPVYVYNCALRY